MLKENYTQFIWNSILENWDRTAFTNYQSASYRYAEVGRCIYYMQKLFVKCGIKKGDKISLIGKNCAEWAIAYQAIVTYGAVVVPILPNFTPNDVQHIVNHSDSVMLFANKSNWDVLDHDNMHKVKSVISLDDYTPLYASNKHLLEHITKFKTLLHSPFSKDKLPRQIIPNGELFAIIYTSGTTGFSKGVMLTHNNITGNMVYARTNMPLIPGDHILSFLPLAHAYGCAIEFLYPFTSGCHITFLGKMPTPQLLLKAFGEIRPRLILSVPLIIEKIFKKQIKPVLEQTKVKFLMKIPFLDNVILGKINSKLTESFGGNFHEIVIGGAALNEEVQEVLRKAGFAFTIGYGMTECGPLISYASWREARFNSAGRCVDQLEMRIDSPDPENVVGEILVRGENVMKGYYKNEKATKEILDKDGWMHTGDLGTMDSEGFLYIKGRSKSMILGPSGQNIYPEEIEARINAFPLVQESIVVDRKEGLVALIYPDMEMVDSRKMKEHALESIMEVYRKHLNREVPNYMQIARFQVVDTEFEKTPKRSIKRFLYS
ncbi:MAG: AMP-binding protein [Bacteroidales bacterium]